MSKDIIRFKIEKPIAYGICEEELIRDNTGFTLYISYGWTNTDGSYEALSQDIPYSEEQAKKWAKENLTDEEYHEMF